MRSCQFCGAAVEYMEPSAPEQTTVEAQAAESPFEKPVPDAPLAGAAAPLAPKPAPAKAEPKSILFSYVIPLGVGLIAAAIIFLAVGRVLYVFSNHPVPISSADAASSRSTSRSSAIAAANLGVDIYPGARPLAEADHSDSSSSASVSQAFLTLDKTDLVINFYKARMVGHTTIYASGNGVVVSIAPSARETVQIAIAPDASPGQTRISITHTMDKSAQ
jgi:hypothetical protein